MIRSAFSRAPSVLETVRLFHRLSLSVALLAAFFAHDSSQQRDPVLDFCRRFGHQTAIVDNKLYIDGGLVNFNPIQQYPLNYTSTYRLLQPPEPPPWAAASSH